MPTTSRTICRSDPSSTPDVTLASIVQLNKFPAEILRLVLPREHWDQSGDGTPTPQSIHLTAASSSPLATSTACTVIQDASCLYNSINHDAACFYSSINHDAGCLDLPRHQRQHNPSHQSHFRCSPSRQYRQFHSLLLNDRISITV